MVLYTQGDVIMIYTNKNEYLEILVDKYSNLVYRLAMSRTKNRDLSEDVYQEVFLRLSKKLPNFENETHEKAWLIRVTINCSKNILGIGWFKNTTELSEEILFEEKDKHEVYYEVMTLPLKYRTVIHLFYYEGYKIEEISKILHINENTVKSQLARAREKLKTKIEGGFDDE
jgi:RNA polymerase sigma-70 factor (ECF subfamily)